MQNIIKFIILNSIRDKIYLSIFLSLVITFSFSIFFGNSALVEQHQTNIVYIAAASRNIIIFGIILFVCLTISKNFENKEFEFIISKAISREKFILSYLVGFLLISLFIILSFLIMLFSVAKINLFGFFLWSLSMIFESIIMISFALLSTLILRSAFLSIIATLSFYLISRMMGFFVLAIELPENFSQAKNNFLELILKIISIFFPRLDLFSQSSWLIYEIENFDKIKIILLQSAIYIPLLIFMSFHDFRKKEF